MTYPNYQQPPGINQPQYYTPNQYVVPQFVPPQHQPQPAYAPPAPAPAANLPQGDFANPRVGGGDPEPRIRHLNGRTVIIEPLRIDENAKGMADASGVAAVRPALYAHVTVVDGGPIAFGNEVKGGSEIKPNDRQVSVPYRINNMIITNTWIVNACRDALPPIGNGLVLGVIVRGTQGNNPFLLNECEKHTDGSPRPDGAQRREAARQLWNAIKAGQFANPTPVLLQPVAGSAYAAANPYAAPQGYGQPVNPVSTVPAAPQPAPYVEQYPGQHQQAQAMNAAAIASGTQPAPVASLPPGFDVTQCPPGWDAGQWQAFAANPAQATAIWTNVLQQQQAGQQQPAPAGAPQPDPAQRQAQYAGAAYQAMNTMNGGVPGPTWT